MGREASITCHVECSPLCGLEWLVDGELVEENGGEEEEEDGGSGEGEVVFEGYSVEMEELEEDEKSNQFSSIKSTLSWKQLIHIDGNYTIACRFYCS